MPQIVTVVERGMSLNAGPARKRGNILYTMGISHPRLSSALFPSRESKRGCQISPIHTQMLANQYKPSRVPHPTRLNTRDHYSTEEEKETPTQKTLVPPPRSGSMARLKRVWHIHVHRPRSQPRPRWRQKRLPMVSWNNGCAALGIGSENERQPHPSSGRFGPSCEITSRKMERLLTFFIMEYLHSAR